MGGRVTMSMEKEKESNVHKLHIPYMQYPITRIHPPAIQRAGFKYSPHISLQHWKKKSGE